jgi:tetratricopeptide (TPR) repeat protein
MGNLGQLREDQDDLEQAETLYRRTYELYRRILGPDHPRTLIPLNSLLRVLNRQGKTGAIRPLAAERLAHLRRAAERTDQQPGALALALHAYAWELLNCEVRELLDPGAALSAARRAVEMNGGRHAGMLETLAQAYRMNGDLDRAIENQRRAVAAAQSGGLYDRSKMEDTLRDYLLEKGDLAGAFDLSWDRLAKGLGAWVLPEGWLPSADSPDMELIRRSESLIEEGRFLEAAEVLRGCLAMRRKALPQGHWLIADAASRLGGAITAEGNFVEAEPLLLEAYAALEGNPLVADEEERRAIERIVRLYEAWEKPDRASDWRRRLAVNPEGGAGGD